MRKFNGHESFMIQEGLKLYASALKGEIKAVEEDSSKGNPIMTQGFVDMSVGELNAKVIDMTKKQKK